MITSLINITLYNFEMNNLIELKLPKLCYWKMGTPIIYAHSKKLFIGEYNIIL